MKALSVNSSTATTAGSHQESGGVLGYEKVASATARCHKFMFQKLVMEKKPWKKERTPENPRKLLTKPRFTEGSKLENPRKLLTKPRFTECSSQEHPRKQLTNPRITEHNNLENPRKFLTKLFEETKARTSSVNQKNTTNSDDGVLSGRSRLRSAIQDVQKRIEDVMQDSAPDLCPTSSSSSSASGDGNKQTVAASVRTGDGWANFYREQRVQRRHRNPTVTRSLQRRRDVATRTTSGNSFAEA